MCLDLKSIQRVLEFEIREAKREEEVRIVKIG